MKIEEPVASASGSRLLRETVYEQIRADILSLKLAPGAEMREAELAARFNVSKSPVRDALMRLERESLVITLPRQGYRVAPVSLSDVQDMFHLRAALERACMERIVRQASDEQLASLEPFRKFERDAWEGGFIDYNRAFHRKLAEIAGNPRMRDQLNNLIDQMERVVLMSVNRVTEGSGNTSVLVDEHCHIIDMLQQRQVKRAERLAEQHIAAAGKRVSEAISRSIIAA
jgi:GntR family transcriptional regulator, rspAB operon transcriptional repressor